VSIPDAQDVGAGGNGSVRHWVVVGIGEYDGQSGLRLDDAGD
jgi:hypothetical protein